VEENDRGLI